MAEELNNPLFEDEREFLERKKQEYERALRGDVDHIKEQGAQVGKVALVGAGLAGSIWLISRLFGGKSKKKNKKKGHAGPVDRDDDYPFDGRQDRRFDFDDDDEFELDEEAFGLDPSAEFANGYGYFGDGDEPNGGGDFRGDRSARESARDFAEAGHDGRSSDRSHGAYYEDEPERYSVAGDDRDDEPGFDNGFAPQSHQADRPSRTTHANVDDLPNGRLDFGPAVHHHRRGYETAEAPALAYDDSRRLPNSTEFAAGSKAPAKTPKATQAHKEDHDFALEDGQDVDFVVDGTRPATLQPGGAQPALGQRVGSALKSFLATDTGKSMAAQATAAALAFLTNKANDKQPAGATAKNTDLAATPASSGPAAPASPAPSSSAPASPTLTDAPTEHPAS